MARRKYPHTLDFTKNPTRKRPKHLTRKFHEKNRIKRNKRARRLRKNPSGRFRIQGVAGNKKFFFTGDRFSTDRHKGIVYLTSEKAAAKANALISMGQTPDAISSLRVVGA